MPVQTAEHGNSSPPRKPSTLAKSTKKKASMTADARLLVQCVLETRGTAGGGTTQTARLVGEAGIPRCPTSPGSLRRLRGRHLGTMQNNPHAHHPGRCESRVAGIKPSEGLRGCLQDGDVSGSLLVHGECLHLRWRTGIGAAWGRPVGDPMRAPVCPARDPRRSERRLKACRCRLLVVRAQDHLLPVHRHAGGVMACVFLEYKVGLFAVRSLDEFEVLEGQISSQIHVL
ncbi:hypothetical protein C8Q79DRAFT_948906 [Trametes meyenii]|nr:hypothetical protein C8Q79DRAFT_948906 [Trametes meyenii]